MKTRIKHGFRQPTAVEESHSVFNRLRSILTSNKQLPALVPYSVRVNVLEQRTLEDKLIALELERKQATGLAYATMLPPK